MNKEEALSMLQGQWKSEDGKLSFEIVDKEIINIKGVKVTKSFLNLKWNDTFRIWAITVPDFCWVSALITKLDKRVLSIYDYKVRLVTPGILSDKLPESQIYTFQRINNLVSQAKKKKEYGLV